MKKCIKSALILLLSLFLSFFGTVYASEDGERIENDPDISLSVSASQATENSQNLTDSGKIRSESLENVFSFFVKDKNTERKIYLVYTVNGETRETRSKYFSYGCKSEKDYGTVHLTVKDENGNVLSEYFVDLEFAGEGNFFVRKTKEFLKDFKSTFIEKSRWKTLLKGLKNTLIITICALALGIALGAVVATIRSTYDKNKESYKLRGGFGGRVMLLLNTLCKLYLTVIRGTPVVVQLLIMYFIIFAGKDSDFTVAILTFGINSGAYVAEILRGGILSVDNGQFEAGRSLGYNYIQTMIYIVLPQMFKASLPALCNEFISLLKETSVAGYVPIIDLTKAGNIIRSSTYSAFLPLIAVALIYLTIVIILTKLVALLERRLRKNER